MNKIDEALRHLEKAVELLESDSDFMFPKIKIESAMNMIEEIKEG